MDDSLTSKGDAPLETFLTTQTIGGNKITISIPVVVNKDPDTQKSTTTQTLPTSSTTTTESPRPEQSRDHSPSLITTSIDKLTGVESSTLSNLATTPPVPQNVAATSNSRLLKATLPSVLIPTSLVIGIWVWIMRKKRRRHQDHYKVFSPFNYAARQPQGLDSESENSDMRAAALRESSYYQKKEEGVLDITIGPSALGETAQGLARFPSQERRGQITRIEQARNTRFEQEINLSLHQASSRPVTNMDNISEELPVYQE